MIKNSCRWMLLAGLAAASPAWAQVQLTCRLAHQRLVLHEPAVITLTVENQLAVPVDLAGTPDAPALSFDVERSPGRLLSPAGAPLFSESVWIAPQGTRTFQFDLRMHYPLREEGPYSVCARLALPDRALTSAKLFFDVVPGLPILSLTAGTRDPADGVRKYSLVSISREMYQYIFLRILDEARNQCFGTYELGPFLRYFKPVLLLDGEAQVHVLHQSGPNQFIHNVFTPNGRPVQHGVYRGDIGRMRLEKAPNGSISVFGGKPVSPDDDEPEPKPAPLPLR